MEDMNADKTKLTDELQALKDLSVSGGSSSSSSSASLVPAVPKDEDFDSLLKACADGSVLFPPLSVNCLFFL